MAASQMCAGVLKSGSPALSEMIDLPSRFSSLAFDVIFIVSEGERFLALVDIICGSGSDLEREEENRENRIRMLHKRAATLPETCNRSAVEAGYLFWYFSLSASATRSGTNEERFPPQAAISLTIDAEMKVSCSSGIRNTVSISGASRLLVSAIQIGRASWRERR